MPDSEKVRHRPLVPFDYGTLDENAATFYSNNLVFDGFKDVQIQKSMTQLADSFQIALTDKWQVEKEDFDLKPGSRIHSHLGKEAVFEGYVDRYGISITPGSRNITISGRSRTADLVDCTHEGPTDYNDIGMLQLAEQICSPFGIRVLNPDNVSMGAIFQKFSVKPGETAFEALNRAARQRELILLSSTHGNLIITKRSKKRAGTELVEGINVTLNGAIFDNTERFSEYTVKGQQSGLIADIDQTTSSKAKAKDNGIKRYRPLTIINDNASSTDDAQKRANYENAVRAAKAMSINCSVIDWRKKDGSLWAINELVPIQAPSIGVTETLLIKSVTYKLGQDGRSCDLELVRKDAFLFEPEKKEDADPLASLGWDS
jgi:prophage tail gpP-like protein